MNPSECVLQFSVGRQAHIKTLNIYQLKQSNPSDHYQTNIEIEGKSVKFEVVYQPTKE